MWLAKFSTVKDVNAVVVLYSKPPYFCLARRTSGNIGDVLSRFLSFFFFFSFITLSDNREAEGKYYVICFKGHQLRLNKWCPVPWHVVTIQVIQNGCTAPLVLTIVPLVVPLLCRSIVGIYQSIHLLHHKVWVARYTVVANLKMQR